jgi:hypothetical protein
MSSLKNSGLLSLLFLGSLFLLQCTTPSDEQSWQDHLETVLSEAGHRNWIVIADAAYPKQSAPGIQTIATGEDHLTVLNYALNGIKAAAHVNPIIMVDAELNYVSEDGVKGIEEYRNELKKVLQGKAVLDLEHERIISKLDEASSLFNILILKTNMDMPYTSVFIELDCGYWDAEQEEKMRMRMDVDSL